MTREEFIAAVDKLGGTAKTTRLLGVSDSHISIYKKGTRKVGALMASRIQKALSENFSEETPKQNATEVASRFNNNRTIIRFYPERANAGVGIPFDSPERFYREVDESLIRNPERSFCMYTNGDLC